MATVIQNNQGQPNISNIFLDFLNRESREIFGLFNILSAEKHINLLSQAINISVFICRENCIATPGSIAECNLVRIAMNRKYEFLQEHLIRLPLREDSLGDLWEKKEREYRLFEKDYMALYSQTGKRFVEKYSSSVINRTTNVSQKLIESWLAGPDENPIWRSVANSTPSKYLKEIRMIPWRLKEAGLAIKGPTIVKNVRYDIGCSKSHLRHILQNHYFNIYLKEYGLELLYEIPYFKNRYGFSNSSLYYHYLAIRASLLHIGLWDIILNMSASSLCQLRRMPGYYIFRDKFFEIAIKCTNIDEISRLFSLSTLKIKPIIKETQLLDSILDQKINTARGVEFCFNELYAIEHRLKNIAVAAVELFDEVHYEAFPLKKDTHKDNHGMVDKMIHGENISTEQFKSCKIVAVFVALKMEREILIDRWSLVNIYPSNFWTGMSENTIILLYGPDQIGRVQAAISTMKMFYTLQLEYECKPNLLIVAGIAGGFQAETVNLGHIIIAESVADLARRKITDNEKNISPEFRPKEFAASNKIATYVKSGDFGMDAWIPAAMKNAEWPPGLSPVIHFGTIASMDEVVSSDKYVELLHTAWPKLLGIEMEAGGVCAAADDFNLRVDVIRGVSDLADPMKSDDEWRRRAMKTLAFLIERIDFDAILNG